MGLDSKCTGLDAKAFGLAGGIIWGIAVFLMALVSGGTGYGIGFVYAIGTIYLGVQPGIAGAILGLIYGFIDAFIGCFIFAWLYNKLSGCCPSKAAVK